MTDEEKEVEVPEEVVDYHVDGPVHNPPVPGVSTRQHHETVPTKASGQHIEPSVSPGERHPDVKLVRHDDWRPRMHAHHATAIGKEFKWGEHDCAKYAASHVYAITGEQFGDEITGYTTAIGALKKLKENGHDDLKSLVAKHLPEVLNSYAHVGDLALLEGDETGWGIGIYLGEHVGVLTPKGYGLVRRDDVRIKHSYKVGH